MPLISSIIFDIPGSSFVKTPFWPNGCVHSHANEIYVGSCKIDDLNQIDVYIFDMDFGGNRQQHTCIRYGRKDYEYVSAGTVIDLLFSAKRLEKVSGFRDYTYAAALILDKCKTRFELNI